MQCTMRRMRTTHPPVTTAGTSLCGLEVVRPGPGRSAISTSTQHPVRRLPAGPNGAGKFTTVDMVLGLGRRLIREVSVHKLVTLTTSPAAGSAARARTPDPDPRPEPPSRFDGSWGVVASEA